MSTNRTVGDLVNALNSWGKSGQIRQATAASMRSACERVLGSLDDETRKDVSQIDVPDAVNRFHNLNPDVTPVSLRSYKSRIGNAIEMFIAFRKDPTNWKPGIKTRAPRKKQDGAPATTTNGVSSANTGGGGGAASGSSISAITTLTIPFPLRPEVTVNISGLPRDLSLKECERLAAFLRPLAIDYTQ